MDFYLKLYFVGIGVALVTGILERWFYNYRCHISQMPLKEYAEEILGSLFSWLTVLFHFFCFVAVKCGSQPAIDYDYELAMYKKELEESLRNRLKDNIH